MRASTRRIFVFGSFSSRKNVTPFQRCEISTCKLSFLLEHCWVILVEDFTDFSLIAGENQQNFGQKLRVNIPVTKLNRLSRFENSDMRLNPYIRETMVCPDYLGCRLGILGGFFWVVGMVS